MKSVPTLKPLKTLDRCCISARISPESASILRTYCLKCGKSIREAVDHCIRLSEETLTKESSDYGVKTLSRIDELERDLEKTRSYLSSLVNSSDHKNKSDETVVVCGSVEDISTDELF